MTGVGSFELLTVAIEESPANARIILTVTVVAVHYPSLAMYLLLTWIGYQCG